MDSHKWSEQGVGEYRSDGTSVWLETSIETRVVLWKTKSWYQNKKEKGTYEKKNRDVSVEEYEVQSL